MKYNRAAVSFRITMIVAISSVVTVTGFSIVQAAWAPPTAPAPGGNVAAPLNVSSADQTKSGSLTIGGDFFHLNSGDIYVSGVAKGLFWATSTDATKPHLNYTDPVLYLSPGESVNSELEIQGTTRITRNSGVNGQGSLIIDNDSFAPLPSRSLSLEVTDTGLGADIKSLNTDLYINSDTGTDVRIGDGVDPGNLVSLCLNDPGDDSKCITDLTAGGGGGGYWSQVGSFLYPLNDTWNVGIGDESPLALFTVGNGDRFRIDANGNLIRVNNIAYSWPAVQGAADTYLRNDGAGNLSWTSVAGGGGDTFKVKSDGSDTENYLASELTAGTGILIDTVSVSGDLKTRITSVGGSGDSLWTGVEGGTINPLSPTTTKVAVGHNVIADSTQFSVKNNSTNAAIYGEQSNSSGFAGYFSGRTVFTGGNVGVNTVNPQATLHVNGSIRTPILSCTGLSVLETDANGNITCGSDDTGGSGSDNFTVKATGSDNTPEVLGTELVPGAGIWTEAFNVGGGNYRLRIHSLWTHNGVNSVYPAEINDKVRVGNATEGDNTSFATYNNSINSAIYAEQLNSSGYSGYFSGKFVVANGNVGINDATPASLFTVGAGGLLRIDTNGNLVRVRNVTYSWPNAQGAASTYLRNDGSGNLTWAAIPASLPAGTTCQTLRHDGTNWVANSILCNDGSNIGLGLTDPQNRLDVAWVGGGYAALRRDDTAIIANEDLGALYFTGDDGANGAIGAQIKGIATADWGPNDYPTKLTFSTSPDAGTSLERMVITEAGNVGIGVTAPTQRLHVTGNARISGLISCDTIDTDANGNMFCGSDATGAGGTLSGSGTVNYLSKFTAATTLGNSIVFDNGSNVGIGTNTPNARLKVVGATTTDQLALGQGSDGYLRLGSDSADNAYIASNASHVGSGVWNYVNPAGYGGAATKLQMTGALAFSTVSGGTNPISWNTRFYVANDGKVGIGTITPLVQLDVTGAIRAQSDGGLALGNVADVNRLNVDSASSELRYINSTNAYGTFRTNTLIADGSNDITINAPSGNPQIQSSAHLNLNVATSVNVVAGKLLRLYNGGTSENSYLYRDNDWLYFVADATASGVQFQSTAGTNTVAFLNTGSVGVGLSNPTGKFVVNNALAGTGSAGDAIAGYANSVNSAIYGQQSNASGHAGYFSGRVAMMNGNVGIGTNVPARVLDINPASGNGTARIKSTALAVLEIDGVTSPSLEFRENGTLNGMLYWNSTSDYLALTSASADTLALKNNNVGIGQTNPTYKLDVTGSTRIAGQITITGGSPGAGKVLTSNASGLATWSTISAPRMMTGVTAMIGADTQTAEISIASIGCTEWPNIQVYSTVDASGDANWNTNYEGTGWTGGATIGYRLDNVDLNSFRIFNEQQAKRFRWAAVCQ